MKSLIQFLNSKTVDKSYEELISILDKLDFGNIEMLSDEEFQTLLTKLMDLSSSDKLSDTTKLAVIDKLEQIQQNITIIVKHFIKQKRKLEKK